MTDHTADSKSATDYVGLVATLRNHAAGYELKIDDYTPRKLREAADAIEQLQAEQVKDLADVDRFRGMARRYMDERDALRAEIEQLKSASPAVQRAMATYEHHSELLALRAKCERYEKALRQFADLDCGDSSCMFAEHITGMRTNGGCRCLNDVETGLAASRGPYHKFRAIKQLAREALAEDK